MCEFFVCFFLKKFQQLLEGTVGVCISICDSNAEEEAALSPTSGLAELFHSDTEV